MKMIEDDIFNAKEFLILHQVNIYGNMSGGVAACIAEKYPETIATYRQFCLDKACDLSLLADVFYAQTENSSHIICNLFSQKTRPDCYGNLTDYLALWKCLMNVKDFIISNSSVYGDKLWSVAVPYEFGCGIADGGWFRIKHILGEFEHDMNDLAFDHPPFEIFLYKI